MEAAVVEGALFLSSSPALLASIKAGVAGSNRSRSRLLDFKASEDSASDMALMSMFLALIGSPLRYLDEDAA